MTTVEKESEILWVSPTELVPAEDNLRAKVVKDQAFKDLVASIKGAGVLVPLTATKRGENGSSHLLVVAGHRRREAAISAEVAQVPVLVIEMTEDERVVAMLVENLQRKDLDPIEEASGYFRLMEAGMTAKEMARRVGRSQKHVTGRLALLKLPDVVQTKVSAGEIDLEDAAFLSTKVGEVDEAVLLKAAEGRDPEREMQYLERQAKSAAKVDAAIAKWEKRKVKAVRSQQELGADAKTVRDALNHPDDEVVKAHAKEPCHAVVVHGSSWSDSVDEAPYCTEPKRHLKSGASEIKRVVRRDERAAAERAANKAINTAHAEAMAVLFAKPVNAKTFESLLPAICRHSISYTAYTDIGKALNLEPKMVRGYNGKEEPSYEEAVTALYDEPASARKVLTAWLVTRSSMGDRSQLLQALVGYEPIAEEQRELDLRAAQAARHAEILERNRQAREERGEDAHLEEQYDDANGGDVDDDDDQED